VREATGCGRLVGVKNWEFSGCGRLVGVGDRAQFGKNVVYGHPLSGGSLVLSR
jgi:hypothetical protein